MSTTPQVSYPTLPRTLLLISTKSYFSPTRTLNYLSSLVDPTNGILPLPLSHSHNPHQEQQRQPQILLSLLPDFLTIHPCSLLLQQNYPASGPVNQWPLALGAQDCHWETDYGPHTGSIVPSALAELGVSIVELGHAERRCPPLSESDALIAAKASAVCSCGMIPLICIGEIHKPDLNGPMSASVGSAMREISTQVKSVLDKVPREAPVILAYEPVWAIGADKPAGVEYVGAVVQGIRSVVGGMKGRTGTTRVVYGGSAGPGLWNGQGGEAGKEGLGKYVDGMFLGRFAHEIDGVKRVVDEVVESLKKAN